MSLHRAARILAAVVAAVALSGCVSLLPKSKPAQLYRFGDVAAQDAAPGEPAPDGPGIVLAQVSLPNAAQGDGLLTITGDQAAYIAGARWVSPAALLFREGAEQALQARVRRVRLLDRGALGLADALLRLDVTRFEVRYDPAAPSAPPHVSVAVLATLTRADGRQVAQHLFASAPVATADRVSAIVEAYNAAVGAVLAQVATWTDQTTPALAAPSGGGATSTTSGAPQ